LEPSQILLGRGGHGTTDCQTSSRLAKGRVSGIVPRSKVERLWGQLGQAEKQQAEGFVEETALGMLLRFLESVSKFDSEGQARHHWLLFGNRGCVMCIAPGTSVSMLGWLPGCSIDRQWRFACICSILVSVYDIATTGDTLL
jgi:hypothetical protein